MAAQRAGCCEAVSLGGAAPRGPSASLRGLRGGELAELVSGTCRARAAQRTVMPVGARARCRKRPARPRTHGYSPRSHPRGTARVSVCPVRTHKGLCGPFNIPSPCGQQLSLAPTAFKGSSPDLPSQPPGALAPKPTAAALPQPRMLFPLLASARSTTAVLGAPAWRPSSGPFPLAFLSRDFCSFLLSLSLGPAWG